MELVTRYHAHAHGRHGWYLGSDAEVVLDPGEPEVWPGVFEAYCRLRGWGPRDFEFTSSEDEAEFLRDVHRSDAQGL